MGSILMRRWDLILRKMCVGGGRWGDRMTLETQTQEWYHLSICPKTWSAEAGASTAGRSTRVAGWLRCQRQVAVVGQALINTIKWTDMCCLVR